MAFLKTVREAIAETLLKPAFAQYFISSYDPYPEEEARWLANMYTHVLPDLPEYFMTEIVCDVQDVEGGHGLPSHIYNYFIDGDFWGEVREKLRQKGHSVYFEGITSDRLGLYRTLHLYERARRLLNKPEFDVDLKYEIRNVLERSKVRSPLEQIFYVTWERVRRRLEVCGESCGDFLAQFVLKPQHLAYKNEALEPLLRSDIYEYLPRLSTGTHSSTYRLDFVVLREKPYPDDRDDKLIAVGRLFYDEELFELHKIAIECDSYEYHAKEMTPKRFSALKQRERFFNARGWTTFAFSGGEIWNEPGECIREVHKYLIKLLGAEPLSISNDLAIYANLRDWHR